MAKRKRATNPRAEHHPSKKFKPHPPPTAAAPAPASSKPSIPFNPDDRILLIGEGDFSFAKAIVEHHGCCDVTATCFDSRDALLDKYSPQAEEHVRYLEDEGQRVLYGVDATKLDSHKALKSGGRFDRVVFNFPHVGGKTKDVNRQVRFNQELIVKFFSAASKLLSPDGAIFITIFEGEPYSLWNVKDLARHSGLAAQTSFKFSASAYPGYSHARTLGNVDGGGGWKGEDRRSRTFVFRRKDEQGGLNDVGAKTGKKGARDSDSDEEG